MAAILAEYTLPSIRTLHGSPILVSRSPVVETREVQYASKKTSHERAVQRCPRSRLTPVKLPFNFRTSTVRDFPFQHSVLVPVLTSVPTSVPDLVYKMCLHAHTDTEESMKKLEQEFLDGIYSPFDTQCGTQPVSPVPEITEDCSHQPPTKKRRTKCNGESAREDTQ